VGARFLSAVLVAALASPFTATAARAAKLRFEIVDDESGRATPARITLVDEEGRSHVPPASLPVAGECEKPAPAWWTDGEAEKGRGTSLLDTTAGARAFYVDGPVEIDVPPGRYRLVASKGFEYRVASLPIEVGEDGATAAVRLERWIDMPSRGWFSADGHLHVSRPHRDLDPLVGRWMAAEDLHVANLLAMGRVGGVAAARQYAFGASGGYREGDTVVAPGQENPRTWVLGHGVVLGAREYLDPGESYLVYQPVWEKARAQGALSGYAHWFAPGVMIDAPTGLIDFLEVLQVDVPNDSMLYRTWDLGLRIAPTAGTDFPCLEDLPGSVRFYTRVEGELSYASWLAGLRAGRTFVTNGPLLELRVGAGEASADVGGEIALAKPGTVRALAVVRFDPTRDDVEALELVRDGEVAARATSRRAAGEIALESDVEIRASGWLALRTRGTKLDRRPQGARKRFSASQTAPVWIDVAGTPPLGTGPRARAEARAALAEIATLRALFEPSGEGAFLEIPDWRRNVGVEQLRKSRTGVLAELDRAAKWYQERAAATEPTATPPAPAEKRH